MKEIPKTIIKVWPEVSRKIGRPILIERDPVNPFTGDVPIKQFWTIEDNKLKPLTHQEVYEQMDLAES